MRTIGKMPVMIYIDGAKTRTKDIDRRPLSRERHDSGVISPTISLGGVFLQASNGAYLIQAISNEMRWVRTMIARLALCSRPSRDPRPVLIVLIGVSKLKGQTEL